MHLRDCMGCQAHERGSHLQARDIGRIVLRHQVGVADGGYQSFNVPLVLHHLPHAGVELIDCLSALVIEVCNAQRVPVQHIEAWRQAVL